MISRRLVKHCRGGLAGLALGLGFAAQAVAAGAMHTGGLTSQPIGHYEFCKTHEAECNIRSIDIGPEPMSVDLWQTITSVNSTVNHRVEPRKDLEIYGKDEVWAYPRGYGDCEEYVLEKRRLLIADGLPINDLLITVVRKPDGEGHAVLTVRTDDGDYILDNMSDAVRAWDQTGYRYLKRQATTNTGRWVSIRDGESPLVGAVQ